LIVAGTHGYGRVGGLLVGSVAQGLLQAGVCPVLAVPTGVVEVAQEDPVLATTAAH
jgi:nucleotide-binding universal stress UspA family protein